MQTADYDAINLSYTKVSIPACDSFNPTDMVLNESEW